MFFNPQSVYLPEANKRLTAFRGELAGTSASDLVLKYIFNAEPCLLVPGASDTIKANVAKQYGIDIDEMIIVGSSVTGFSISPKHRYDLFDWNRSDIDIAITSAQLFCDVWAEAEEFIRQTRYWRHSDQFYRYLKQGWMRPDFLPPGIAKRWVWDVVDAVHGMPSCADLGLRFALYAGEGFVKAYQESGVIACQGSA